MSCGLYSPGHDNTDCSLVWQLPCQRANSLCIKDSCMFITIFSLAYTRRRPCRITFCMSYCQPHVTPMIPNTHTHIQTRPLFMHAPCVIPTCMHAGHPCLVLKVFLTRSCISLHTNLLSSSRSPPTTQSHQHTSHTLGLPRAQQLQHTPQTGFRQTQYVYNGLSGIQGIMGLAAAHTRGNRV
jgi:hypothetical protein